MLNLNESVRKDIIFFLRENKKLFFNERDVQMHLALSLKAKNYDNVELEYHIPVNYFSDKCYPWERETLYIDIVVCKDNEYVPIELKYKTKKVKLNDDTISSCLGEERKEVFILQNQAAQNLGRYDFWKDVKRMEVVKNHFKKVSSGFAVFLTNDQSYKTKDGKGRKYEAFSMQEGKQKTNDMKWAQDINKKGRPDFELNNKYTIQWCENKNIKYNTTSIPFYYCIVEIPQKVEK